MHFMVIFLALLALCLTFGLVRVAATIVGMVVITAGFLTAILLAMGFHPY
jgi:hypothetical protein